MAATVLARALVKYADHLRAVGVAPEPLLRAVGLSPDVTADVDRRIPFDRLLAFVDEAARATGDEALGVHVAERSPVRAYDVLGFAALSSPTLRAAFERVDRYFRAWQEGADLELSVEGDEARLTYRVHVPGPGDGRIDAEHTFAACWVAARVLTGVEGPPLGVWIAHPPPRDRSEQLRFFGEVRYDAPADVLRFDAGLLDRPVRSSDPALLALVDRHARELLALRPAQRTLRERVRAAVVQALQRREAAEVQQVARELATSVRSLQRALGEDGTSFREEADAARRELALRHVAEDRLALCEIAFLLGYSDTRAFGRAFRRWTGTSPASWRACGGA